MRRIAGAILLLACAVCLAGSVMGPRPSSEWIAGPAFLFACMGLYQLGRGRDDDKSS